MVRVYVCINGPQLVPLMPSRFVNTLEKGFGNLLFVHYVVLELGFHVASAKLDKGGDLHRFRGNLDQTLCKRIASLFSPWHGHASHAIMELFAGGNEGTLGFKQGYAVDLGLLLHGHGNTASNIYLPPLILAISELGFFTGLGFCVALVDSAFGVYNVACYGFLALVRRFAI